MFLVLYFFIGILTCAIGALPLGLVNLSVVNTSVSYRGREWVKIAYGATVIELFFALIALFSSKFVFSYIESNYWIKLCIVFVLLVSSLVFFLKKDRSRNVKSDYAYSYFLKGVFLNLISIQVLLFWLLAVAFLDVQNLLPNSNLQILLFTLGIGTGKMLVLITYAIIGQKIASQSKAFTKNINRIIGVILLLVAIYQLTVL